MILAFIGVKLVLHALHDNELPFLNGGHHIEWAPEINTWVSLLVIVAAMAVSMLASLVRMRGETPATDDGAAEIDQDRADQDPARTSD
ncbi:hypothetical protein ARTHRO9V_1570003 [Arthrobacter sp. 9V]|nr:hypothetical protein ARTHRO9V_1570003 [Arthrobacter sp. 9V]